MNFSRLVRPALLRRPLSTHATTHRPQSSRNFLPHASAFAALATVSGVALYQTRAQAEASPTVAAPVPPSAAKHAPAPVKADPLPVILPEQQDVINWSGTHAVSTSNYYQPEDIHQLKAIVRHAHSTRQKIRPIGSALSPNGLPLQSSGMLNLANMDAILSIDTVSNRVTVQAGARVSQVVDALRPHGLTLRNFASITEQQIAGFTQVGAHGTGLTIPPVDEQVVALRLITPAAGEISLSADDDDPSLFRLARTSIGLLGVVAELTLQCVPAHKLLERTFVLSRSEVSANHRALLQNNRHLRYMWIPHTDDVIVVTCNPVKDGDVVEQPKYSMDSRLKPVRELLLSHPKCALSAESVAELQFTSLRDELLALDPLNPQWIKKVNAAEATFWRRSQGTRIDWSDKILQFDCGGQQWVNEIAFPVPKGVDNNPDVLYVQAVLDMIEKDGVAAPAPIEQRWSAPSTSPMSPAGEKPEVDVPEFYSWVGIIMYLPDAGVDDTKRDKITAAFKEYKRKCEEKLWPEVRAVEHWAKIEMPQNSQEKALLQQRIAQKYPTEAFKGICGILDPHGILRNDLTDAIFGMAES